MYTYNMLVFGHNFSIDPQVNNAIHDFDLEHLEVINGKTFEVSMPYHGGQIAGDTFSVVCGFEITDDDQNTNYLAEVKAFVEADYVENYRLFIESYKKVVVLPFLKETESKEEFRVVAAILTFLESREPGVYTVEASS